MKRVHYRHTLHYWILADVFTFMNMCIKKITKCEWLKYLQINQFQIKVCIKSFDQTKPKLSHYLTPSHKLITQLTGDLPSVCLCVPPAPLQTLREHLLCRVLCPQRPHALLQETCPSVWQLLRWPPGLIGPSAPVPPETPLTLSRSPWPLHSKHRSCMSRWAHHAASQTEVTLN